MDIRAIVMLASLGVILLFVAAGALVAFNFSSRLLLPAFGAVVAGLIAAIVTIAASLEGTSRSDFFVTWVVVDMDTLRPKSIFPRDLAQAFISTRQDELSDLFTESAQNPAPENRPKRTALLPMALQFYLLNKLAVRNQEGWSVQTFDTKVADATVTTPPPKEGLVPHPAPLLADAMTSNWFFHWKAREPRWRMPELWIPEGTQIELRQSLESEAKTEIWFRNPHHFSVCVRLEGMGIPMGVPQRLADQLDATKDNLGTDFYKVSIDMKFEWISSRGPHADEHKQWATWLSDQVRELLKT